MPNTPPAPRHGTNDPDVPDLVWIHGVWILGQRHRMASLCVALKRWCRHHRLLTEDLVLDLSVTGPMAGLSITENRPLHETRELCLLTTLRHAQGYACWAIDSRIPLERVDFPFASPPHAAMYPLLFRTQVHFGATRAGITFDAQYLSMPLRRDEQALRNMLRRALPLTVRQYRSDRLVVRRLRDLLRVHSLNLGTGDSLASALNVSLRTLHRRLLEEGTSLQRVKNQVRQELATSV